jgi:hypothetical protein
MGNKAVHEQQFANAAGMIPPSMSLPSAALDPKAAARAEAAAAAGARQKQLEAAAEAVAAQQKKLCAQQSAIQEESDRRQRLKEAAQESAKNRQMQLERAAMEARAHEAGSVLPRPAPVSSSSMGASVHEGVNSHSVSAQPQTAPQVQSLWGQPHGQPNASVSAPEPTASPAVKANPGAQLPPQNVWGAVPSSILKAPAPVEEKKPAAQQQKVVKTENVPQQKNAWGNVKVGQKAEVKPGTVKNSSAPSQLVQKADSNEGMDHLKPPQQDWEQGAMENDVQNQEGGDVVRARRMLDDFLKMRGMQQEGQDGEENDPWSSENAHRVTEDSNDTDEVFFMRPNGVVMLAAPGEKNTHAPTGWEAGGNQQRVSPVKPSAWALGAPRIADRDRDEGFGSSFVQGFGQVDGPAGLMAFELSCDGGDAFSSAGGSVAPAASAWGNSTLQVNTKDEGDDDKNGQDGSGEKSPSVALKMLLGIGMGGAALPGAPAAAPPAARKLPVWGKPDGQVDISMDPAIAQIATDMPPPARGTPYQQHAQEVERERAALAAIRNQQKAEDMARKAAGGVPAAPDVNRSVFDSEHDKSGEKGPLGVGSSWESTAQAPENQLRQQAPMDPPAPGPQANLALAQNIQHKHSGLPKHLGQMETQSSLMQSVPMMQGPSAFGQSGSAQEQGGGMGGNMVRMPPMPTPQQLQQMQPPAFLRGMQDAGGPSWGPNVPGAHDAQLAPSERPPDSMFPFSMGAGMPRSGGGLGGFASMPPMPPVQGMQNTFGMGGLGIMASHAGPGDNSNLPLWMQQQQQAPPMGIGNMGNMGFPPNAGHPGDNIGLPPWMRQQQGPPMGMGPQGGFGNGLPPGMGMGPMGPMGPVGGMDLLKVLGSQEGPPHMGVGMGGQGAGEPHGQQGFGFPAEQASGEHATGAQAGGDGGSGGFDFNKVFGGMKSTGQGSMPQLPPMSGPGPMPGTMLSLAGMLSSSAFSCMP